MDCPCCLEEIDASSNYVRLTCNHAVHFECFHKWSMIKMNGVKSCAFCRTPVDPGIRQSFDTHAICKRMSKEMLNVQIGDFYCKFSSVTQMIKFMELYRLVLAGEACFNKRLAMFENSERTLLVYNELCARVKKFQDEWKLADERKKQMCESS